MKRKDNSRYIIKSVVQAGKVLEAVANSKEPLGINDIATLAGLKPNMVFRLCATLSELGWLNPIGERHEIGMGIVLFWSKKKAALHGQKIETEKQIKELED